MSEVLHLTATLHPRGPAGAFVLTDDQVAAIGAGRKTFPVTVRLNGHTLRLRLARMGEENLIGLSKAARAEGEVEIGSTLDVEIAADLTPREVELPADLAAALAGDAAASATYERLPYSHRKEYVRWITEAKREQTRLDRVAKAVEMLRDGRHR